MGRNPTKKNNSKTNLDEKITRKEAERMGWKAIQTRWIDVHKGDADNPVYRSRLIGKAFNTGHEDGLFASTPPSEALRMLVSMAATVNKKNERIRRMRTRMIMRIRIMRRRRIRIRRRRRRRRRRKRNSCLLYTSDAADE